MSDKVYKVLSTIFLCLSFFCLGWICSNILDNRKTTESIGNIEQSTTDSYTESRVDVERLNGTIEELKRTSKESKSIFDEIRTQSTDKK